eukprot:scaffold1095_cov63-Phaeocystis_antarctica.AAC.9
MRPILISTDLQGASKRVKGLATCGTQPANVTTGGGAHGARSANTNAKLGWEAASGLMQTFASTARRSRRPSARVDAHLGVMQDRHSARASSTKEYPTVDRAVADLLSSEWSRDKATSLVSRRAGRGKSWQRPWHTRESRPDRKARQRVDAFSFTLQEAAWQVHDDDQAHGDAEAAGRRRCAEAEPEARPPLDRAADRGHGRSAAAAPGVDRVRPRRAARLADAGARRPRAAAAPARPARLRAARRAQPRRYGRPA